MDSGNTNNLNNENINPNLNNTNEDLTNIFDTPEDLNVTNLGVGEASNEYSGENTEVLDLNEISDFKEAEIKVENLDINDIITSEPVVENNPFELNNITNENVEPTITNNSEEVEYSPSSVDNLNPVSLDNLNNNETLEINVSEEPIVNDVENSIQEELVVPNVETNINLEPTIEQPVMENEPSLVQTEAPTIEPVQDVNSQPVMNATENNVKKKKNILPIIIVLVVLGVIGGLIAAYLFIFTSPKNIFNKAIDGGTKYLSNSLSEIGKYDSIIGNGSLSYEMKIQDANFQKTLDMFNGIAFKYEYGIDYKNKLMNFNIDSTYNNEKLLDFDMYTENSKAYILFVDIYNKYISSPIEGYDSLFDTDINQEDLNIILNSFKNALSNSLTDEDFVKSEETIKINGADVKVTKNSFVLNNKNINRIAKNILNILKDDADFISAINKLSGEETVDTKAVLESAAENINEVPGVNSTVIAFSIYTKGILKEVVGFSAEIKATETIKLFVNKTDDITYSYIITTGSEELVSGNIKANITKSDNSENSDVELSLNVKNIGSIKMNVKNNVNYNAVLNKPDISDNIAMEMLPENWMNNIMNGAMANPGFAKLMTNIQTISAQREAEAQQEALNQMQEIENIQNEMLNNSNFNNFNYNY